MKICTGYSCRGQTLQTLPARLKDLEACRPVYEELPGWSQDLSGIRKRQDLPPEAREYLRRMEELIQVPVGIISLGPDREATITESNPIYIIKIFRLICF